MFDMKFIAAKLLIALFVIGLSGCAENQVTIRWNDFTGRNRANAELKMNDASCKILYQQAHTQAEQMYNTAPANCYRCEALTIATVIANNNNIQNYADTAYYNCMRSFGWELQTVQAAPASQKVETNTNNTNVNGKVRRWCEVDADCGSRMSCRVIAGGGTECRAS